MCGVFGMSKVKVPVFFSGTEGFPPHRDGRYLSQSQIYYYKVVVRHSTL